MMKVYVVTTGGYSDYRIEGVFSDKSEADRIVGLVWGRVEEYELNGLKVDDPGMDCFRIWLDKTGKASIEEVSRLCEGGCERQDIYCRLMTDKEYVRSPGYWELRYCGYAKSKEHARRHVEELRRQILAGQRPAEVDFGKN